MKNAIIIASHRRSGTHLTIDSILNNFDIPINPVKQYITLDHFSSHINNKYLSEDYFEMSKYDTCIFKTHAHGNVSDFFHCEPVLKDHFLNLFETAKIMYVYRDGRDVMTSLYYYQKQFDKSFRNTKFSNFLRMENNYDSATYHRILDRPSYWAFHILSWIQKPNILLVRYEDLHEEYIKTLQKIAIHLDIPLKPSITDIRLKAKNSTETLFLKLKQRIQSDITKKINYSSVYFRKGQRGEWSTLFNDDDKAFFEKQAGHVMQKLGYQ